MLIAFTSLVYEAVRRSEVVGRVPHDDHAPRSGTELGSDYVDIESSIDIFPYRWIISMRPHRGKHRFKPTGHSRDQHARVFDAVVAKGVRRFLRDEDERASARLVHLPGNLEGDFPFEDIEQFIRVMVQVPRRPARTRRNLGFIDGHDALGFLA